MGLFRRKGAPDTIAQFWSWWSSEGAHACAAAIAAGEPDQVAHALGERVHTIHRDLAWELTAGEVSEHQLVVTPEGDPDLRAVARRWLLAAPPADRTWSYDDHRGASASPEEVVLQAPGAPEIAFADMQVGARMHGARVDVTVHHPAFADLDEQTRLQATFLALDAALGENDTELWIGEITPASYPPMDAFGLTALRALVDNLRRRHVDEDGRPGWALLSGEGPSGPVVASARSPLHPIFGPLYTRHVAVLVPYRDRTEAGLPGPGSLEALRALEDHLERTTGGDGLLVAHESTAGARVFHLYVDPGTDAARRVGTTVRRWPEGDVRVQVTDDDPGWVAVRHLRQ